MTGELIFALVVTVQGPTDALRRPPIDSAWGTPDTLELREPGDIRQARVWVRIDGSGRVIAATADSSLELSERDADELEDQARELRFVPSGPPPDSIPVVFPVVAAPPPPPPDPELADVVRKPELIGRRRSQRLVEKYYRAVGGISGTTILWSYIDTTGTPSRVQVKSSTGLDPDPNLVFERTLQDAGPPATARVPPGTGGVPDRRCPDADARRGEARGDPS